MKKYRFRLLNVGEEHNEEEKAYLKKKEEWREKKMKKLLEKIRKTEKDGKVYVEGLGRVKAF